MAQRVHNFSAGPATLPLKALEKARDEFLLYPGAGASVIEISHRSKQFESVLQQAKANIKQLLNVPDNFKILFLQGGASLQFSMIAINFLRGTGKSADYILTGSWGGKAINEAKKEGGTRVAWSGKEGGFVRVPGHSELQLDPDAAYCHFTSNETIEGVEFFTEPETGEVPLVCDASSDFLSRPLNMNAYGLLYAGAQKNIGPAGVAVVIVRDDLLERVPEGLHSMLDYKLIAANDSLYNTPASFSIYMIMLVTQWLIDDIGGLDKMKTLNRKKADTLYGVLDASGGYYSGHAQTESRSVMNVTWRLPSEELEGKFVKEATAAGLDGLKGHRSVGGIRASIYNAMTIDGVNALAQFLKDFQTKNG